MEYSNEVENAYRQLSDCSYLDVITGNYEKQTKIKMFVIMHQINSNPEHVKIEGVFLDENQARTLAQTYDFAWVDEHILNI